MASAQRPAGVSKTAFARTERERLRPMRDAAMQQACPDCEAQAGEECKGRRGRRRAPHKCRYKGITVAAAPVVKLVRSAQTSEDILKRTLRLAAEDYGSNLRLGFADYPPDCLQSPIEVAMWLAFIHEERGGLRRFTVEYTPDWRKEPYFVEYGKEPPEETRATIFPQAVIGSYRVDFLACVRHAMGDRRLERFIVVECDGHDFHHASKAQVERDKGRDRFFAREGMLVMRFAGSEIYRNPLLCADQVAAAAEAIYNEWINGIVDADFARWKAAQG